MQTVIELPTEMYMRTEELAQQKGISVQEMIVHVLAKELSSKEPRIDGKHTVELPLIHSKCPGAMDLNNFDLDDLLA